MKTYKNLIIAAQKLLEIHIESDKKGEDNATRTLDRLVDLLDADAMREAQMAETNEHIALSLSAYQELAQRTLPERGRNHFFDEKFDDLASPDDFSRNIDLLHASLKLPSEVGELVDPIARAMFYGKSLTKPDKDGIIPMENIKEEAGDLLWYIASPLCRALGCTMEDLARANIAKLRKRYPDTYSDQAALARADKVEGAV